jgi:pimeloyl-ACP methyl ester carboxylesterase
MSGATFGLIHGGAHGAWCWERLVPHLTAAGYRAVAPDLPCEDDDAGAGEYASVVVDALGDLDDVVLVAHSLGGLTAPIVADRRPVRRIIFIAGLLPVPGLSLRDQQVREPDIMFPYQGGPPGLRERFFGACRPEDADWAVARIRRQALKPFTEPTPLERWPDVPVRYFVCGQDRAVNPAWGRRAAQRRLGIEAIELADSDHSPFLSRPAELAELLVAAAGGRVASPPTAAAR